MNYMKKEQCYVPWFSSYYLALFIVTVFTADLFNKTYKLEDLKKKYVLLEKKKPLLIFGISKNTERRNRYPWGDENLSIGKNKKRYIGVSNNNLLSKKKLENKVLNNNIENKLASPISSQNYDIDDYGENEIISDEELSKLLEDMFED